MCRERERESLPQEACSLKWTQTMQLDTFDAEVEGSISLQWSFHFNDSHFGGLLLNALVTEGF